MTPLSIRQLLPAFILILASLFLVDAMGHAFRSAPTTAQDTTFNVVLAEVQLCEAASGRSRDECIDEEQGKALVRLAERESARLEP